MARVSRACAVVFAAFLLLSVAPTPNTTRPNILLIVVDTLRFDAVSAENTPFLASLGKRAVVFANAHSTHDFTPPRSLTARRGQGVALMAVERDIFILLRLPRG